MVRESASLGSTSLPSWMSALGKMAVVALTAPILGRMLARSWTPGHVVHDRSFDLLGSVPGLGPVPAVELVGAFVLGLYGISLAFCVLDAERRIRGALLLIGSLLVLTSLSLSDVFVPNLDPTLLNGLGLLGGIAFGFALEIETVRALDFKAGTLRPVRTDTTTPRVSGAWVLSVVVVCSTVGFGLLQGIVAGVAGVVDVVAAGGFLWVLFWKPDSGVTSTAWDRARPIALKHPVVVAVLAITVVGLLARFTLLGARVTHWDEARVAYWVDYTYETGRFAYNSHTHGPVVQHLSRYLFGILGPSDTTIRIPVAIIGGLLPVSALLYRDHLRDVEVVILSGFLSANAVLLYYSRFMRSDLLVATFMFTAFGLLVRFSDTRRIKYLYGATACIALGIGSKENAPLYILTWLGAGALLLDTALYRPREYRRGADLVVTKVSQFREWLGDVRANAVRYVGHTVGLVAVFLALITFLFATRGGGVAGIYQPPDGLSLWAAITSPWRLPALVLDTFSYVFYPAGEYFAFAGIDAVVLDLPGPPEVDGTKNTVRYLERLGNMAKGLMTKGAPLVAFAIVGFVRERYTTERSRNLVLLMFYAGVASFFGYPLVFSIPSGWKWGMTHVLVPLAIPAAVGLGILGRWGKTAYRRNDRIDLALTAFVIGIVAILVTTTAVAGAYAPNDRSDENPLVQYAQPGDDLRPALERIEAVAGTHDGTDVIVYDGSSSSGAYVKDTLSAEPTPEFRPNCTVWENTLPLNWYLVAYDAETECSNDPSPLRNRTSGDDPVPIVITKNADDTVPDDHLSAQYRTLTYLLRSYEARPSDVATFYIHEDYWRLN